jgi:Protein of unknown function (DUF2844)
MKAIGASSYLSLILTLIFSMEARATLDEPVDSIAIESGKLHTVVRANKVLATHQKIEIKSDEVSVRQYADVGGKKVFAIAWTGKMNDPVFRMLGRHSTELEKYEAEHPKRTGRSHYRKIETGGVVYEFWDLPKMVKGRAYIPSAMPAGVTSDSI